LQEKIEPKATPQVAAPLVEENIEGETIEVKFTQPKWGMTARMSGGIRTHVARTLYEYMPVHQQPQPTRTISESPHVYHFLNDELSIQTRVQPNNTYYCEHPQFLRQILILYVIDVCVVIYMCVCVCCDFWGMWMIQVQYK
jgi:hypothetical protein